MSENLTTNFEDNFEEPAASAEIGQTDTALSRELQVVLVRLDLINPAYHALIAEPVLVAELAAEAKLYPQIALEKLALRVISRRLYQACQSQNSRLVELVYQWLGSYIYRAIFNRLKQDKPLVEDLTNDCLELIYKNLASCRQPELFIAWVGQLVLNRLKQYFRATKAVALEQGMDAATDAADNPALQGVSFAVEAVLAKLPTPPVANPETIVLRREQIAALLSRISQFSGTKRALYYRKILYGTYFLAKSDAEMAEELGLPVKEIYKMRYQALLVLRRDQSWLDEIS